MPDSGESASLDAWINEVQLDLEQALDEWMPRPAVAPEVLHEAMRYAVLDGGKRIRPLLCFGAALTAGTVAKESLLRAAGAIELIHAYSLVHDDLPSMDNDVLRRGKPTVHVRYGEAMALLAGDALQTLAFEWIGELPEPGPPLRLLAAASGSKGMAGGQAMDLLGVGVRLSRPELEAMHRAKTGALLKASIVMGASLGPARAANDVQREALERYGDAIGLAFQVVDDILDVMTDSQTLGKTAGKDAAQHKPTYVSLLGLDASRQLAASLRDQAHAALMPLGPSANRLRQLADLIVARTY